MGNKGLTAIRNTLTKYQIFAICAVAKANKNGTLTHVYGRTSTIRHYQNIFFFFLVFN